MIPSKNNTEQDKSQKNSTAVLPPKRDANGKFPLGLTAEQIGMLTAEEAADYVVQVALANLNRNAGQHQ